MHTIGRWIFVALFGLFASQAHAQYQAGPGQTFNCKSIKFGQNFCSADTRGGVRIVRQVSESACIEGRTWGTDERGVWVTQGCEALFAVGYRRDEGYGDGDGRMRTIRCESHGYAQEYCDADTRGGVRLLRQNSGSSCIRGRSWDFDRRGIWVSDGCKGDFELGAWDRGGYRPNPIPAPSRLVRCESVGSHLTRCRVDTSGGVRLTRRLSDATCIQGRTWDWDRSGIWVTNGCRGEFAVNAYGDRYEGYDDRRR